MSLPLLRLLVLATAMSSGACFWVGASGTIGTPVAGEAGGATVQARLAVGMHVVTTDYLSAFGLTLGVLRPGHRDLCGVTPVLGFVFEYQWGMSDEEPAWRPVVRVNIDSSPILCNTLPPPAEPPETDYGGTLVTLSASAGMARARIRPHESDHLLISHAPSIVSQNLAVTLGTMLVFPTGGQWSGAWYMGPDASVVAGDDLLAHIDDE